MRFIQLFGILKMLVDDLKAVVDNNKKEVEQIFLRNLLKETLQYYVLDYVYTSRWGERFLFKGGTCLHFCFDLPRLSEDLDFDVKNYDNFNLDIFCKSIREYFTKDLQYKNIEIQIAGNEKQVKLKFPVMKKLGLKRDRSESNLLFLRLDINPVDSEIYNQEVSLISKYNFNFIINRYSLEDLFSSKIVAILTRTFKKGKGDKITFKGRDYFDLIWFLEKNVQPNFDRLKDITGLSKNKVLEKLDEKVEKVDPRYLQEDLIPLFRENKFVEKFCESFLELYKNKRKRLV